MRKLLPFLSSILLAVLPFLAEVANAADQTKDDDRLRNCGTVLKEILDVPDNIPGLARQGRLRRCLSLRPESRIHRWRKLRAGRYVVP